MELFWAAFFTAISLVILLVSALNKKTKQRFKRNQVHYLGHSFPQFLKTLVFTNNHDAVQDYFQTYNEIKRNSDVKIGVTKSFGSSEYTILNLDIIKAIYVKDFNYFVNRFPSETDPILANAVPSAKDEKWRFLRKQFARVFSTVKIDSVFPHFNKSGEKMVEYVKGIRKRSAEPEFTIEAKQMISKFSLDFIASSCFGVDSKSFAPENSGPGQSSEFEKIAGNLQYPLDKWGKMRYLFLRLFPQLSVFLKVPMFKPEGIEYFGKIMKEVLGVRKGSKEYSDLVQVLVQAKKAIENKEKMKDVTSQELDSGDFIKDIDWQMNSETGKEKEYKLEEIHIVAMCIIFIMAGYDTAMSLNVFAFLVLSVKTDLQQNLYDEIEVNLGDSELHMGTLKLLPELDLFIKEMLRMFPPGLFAERVCSENYRVPGTKDLVIKKGDKVLFPIVGIHRDKENFEGPKTFNMDRFRDETEKNDAYMPFGHGPRSCIGFRLGITEVKVGIIHFLKNFEIMPNKDISNLDQVDFTSTMTRVFGLKGGLNLRIRKRKKVM